MRGYRLEEALDFMPAIVLTDDACKALRYGTLPMKSDAVQTIGAMEYGEHVRLLDGNGTLFAVGKSGPVVESGRLPWIESYRLFVDDAGRS